MSKKRAVVAQVNDLKEGEMRQVAVEGTDVLLARANGMYHALHAYCTHYGAPLADGALSGDRVVCPWHHACFNLNTGDQMEPPGLDGLPRFTVEIDGDDVIVEVPEHFEEHRTPSMARRDDEADSRLFAVLGAGAAGAYAVEAIREAGFKGRVVLITREDYPPYDRPNCSKDYLAGEAPEEWMFLRPKSFYKERSIELCANREVKEVDASKQTITFANGKEMAYDGLVLCTGGRPRTLDVPGADLKGVCTLRSFDDSRSIRSMAEGAERAVVVGASFIGMEAAWSLREHGLDVAVVAPEAVPFASVLGKRVGRMIQDLHEENGVTFHLERTVKAFEGDAAVESVELDDGTVLDADLVVVGIGVEPVTGYLKGIKLAKDGSVVVDQYLGAGKGIYAAGDIAKFPDWRTGEPTRIEHWRLACQHGRIAGYNMAGRSVAYRGIPYFWTAHYGTSLRYVGHAAGWDDIVYDGDPADRSFIAYYVRDGKVLAASGVGRDREMAALEELMRRDLMPPVEDLQRGDVDLLARLRQKG